MQPGQLALTALSCAGFVSILALSLHGYFGWGAVFWPPPDQSNWQHRWFRRLFRPGLCPLVGLSLWLLWQDGPSAWQGLVGAVVLGLGFGLALRITAHMGWRNAFGTAQGLVTDGWFARSRNPVYVASWVGMLGWAALLPLWSVLVPLALWGLLYLLVPRFEEPWLRTQYGTKYDDYAARTPRFFGSIPRP